MAGRLSRTGTREGVDIAFGERPILTYHPALRETWRANFVHPLFSPSGQCLTEDGPADHPHHRGVFWAWRRILIDGGTVCDGWTGRDFALRTESPHVRRSPEGAIAISAVSLWHCTSRGQATPIVRERARITALPDRDGVRALRFDIRLRALVVNLAIAGSDDDKGYGGCSIRLAEPLSLQFASEGRVIEPLESAVATGKEVACAWTPRPPGFPARIVAAGSVNGRPWRRWVLRRSLSMQNCAFPGRQSFAVPTDRDLRLGLSLRIEEH